ncbi:ATP-binding cassette domain-containing protein, partial [Aeromonas veronii]|nr:ATP-binding cassette domain-containing protein [Aeromonas veronii]
MTLHLKVEGIETYIDQFHILQGVSFEAKKGEVTVLLGRNCAGKTTTLRSIMGLNPPAKGKIELNGENIS